MNKVYTVDIEMNDKIVIAINISINEKPFWFIFGNI